MKRSKVILVLVLVVSGCASQSQKESAEIENRKVMERAAQKQIELERQAEQERKAEMARQEEVVKAQQDRLAKEMELDQRGEAEMTSPEITTISEGNLEEEQLDTTANSAENVERAFLSKRVIFFGYDRFDIPKEFIPIVEAHAKYLLENPELEITIHGHCDTRGSREYNLALGDRRANSVKRAMLLLGVSNEQIKTVSFGAEKPVAIGQDEESHSQNRRSEIIYEITNLQ